MLFLNWLWQLLLDERGDDAGEGSSSTESGVSSEPPAGESGQEGEAGTGDKPPAAPKYGDFGDTPTVDEIFDAFGKTKTELENFRKKAGLTETNLGRLRQTLDTAGITIGEDGQLRLKEGAGKPKTRFTDSHKALFDGKILEAIQYLTEDMLDTRLNTFSQRTRQEQEFSRILHTSIGKMYQLFPSLQKEISGKANPEFNQAFFDRADEILQQNYRNLPNGDLIAAHEAAIELGISPIALEKAKTEGFQRGIGSKRILGPAKPSGAKAPAGGKLSKEEYLKLSPEEKEAYDRNTIDKVVQK